jgi:hypothetical protein
MRACLKVQTPNLVVKATATDKIILIIPAASKWVHTSSRIKFLVGATNNWR